jgi:hypothetical protein
MNLANIESFMNGVVIGESGGNLYSSDPNVQSLITNATTLFSTIKSNTLTSSIAIPVSIYSAVANIAGGKGSASDATDILAAVASRLALAPLPQAKAAALALTAISLAIKYSPNIAASVSNLVSQTFTSATTPPPRDPLVLDLDGDGIETIGTDPLNPVLFDHNGDGIKTGTGWIKSDDGLLVMDRDSNGSIDTGSELFGADTVLTSGAYAGRKALDGFVALRDLDSNPDGVMDANDAQFANLKVWRDLNQDGVSGANELFTLADLNIASISLAKTAATVNLGNGNTQTATSGFTRTSGTTGTVGNLILASDTFHREYVTPVAISAAVALLPGMQGSGRVRDLWEAANEGEWRVAA